MKRLVSRTRIIVAGSAAAMSVVWAAFGPHGFPRLSLGLSLAWASLACLAVVWVVKGSIRPNRRLGDVIGDVEAARIPGAPVSDRALVPAGPAVDKAEALAEAPNQKLAQPA